MRKIEPASYEDVYEVARNMRDRDFAEFCAISTCTERDDLALDLARRYGGRDDVLCCSLDDEPICIGGLIEAWPHVVTLLFFATPEFPRIGYGLTKWIRNELFPRYFAAGVHRIQAISAADYEEGHAWLRILGLAQETEPMRAYGRKGEDFIQFARVGYVSASD